MNIEDSIRDRLKTTIRTCFEDWLDKYFGLRLDLKNGQLEIFEAFDAHLDTTRHLVYNFPHVERHISGSSGMGIFGLEIPVYDGKNLMKAVVAKHNLRLDFDGESVFITCNKPWCKGRVFELRLERIGGDAQFVVHGLNSWKPFPEKPEGFNDDHIREYILHRMLQL